MRECPWCHRMNLNVYAYCQGCGRGWDGPEKASEPSKRRRIWPFGAKSA